MVMVLSASSVSSYDTDSSVYALFQKHLVFVAVGLVAFWLGVRIPLPRIRALSPAAMVVCLGLLVLVLTPLGTSFYGSQGWIVVGPLSLQPVEIAKVMRKTRIGVRVLLHRARLALVAEVGKQGGENCDASAPRERREHK